MAVAMAQPKGSPSGSARCCGHRASRRPSCPQTRSLEEDVRDADGFVVGSAVYMGHWLKEPTEFLENYPTSLRARPVWLFSSGPLPGSTRSKDPNDPLTDALGPTAGPGSGGRKKIEELAASIGARDHRVFLGRYDPDDPRGRSRNVSSGCCRWRRACSRTATSGTGRTSMHGPPRSPLTMASPAVPV